MHAGQMGVVGTRGLVLAGEWASRIISGVRL